MIFHFELAPEAQGRCGHRSYGKAFGSVRRQSLYWMRRGRIPPFSTQARAGTWAAPTETIRSPARRAHGSGIRLFDVKPRARRAGSKISLVPSGNTAGSCGRRPVLFSGCGTALFHLRVDEALRCQASVPSRAVTLLTPRARKRGLVVCRWFPCPLRSLCSLLGHSAIRCSTTAAW